MKTFFKILTVLFIITATLSGCKKYEEGPKFSLRTKKMRLCHEWKVTSVSVNGVEVTAPVDYKLDIEKSGSYHVSYAGFTDEGKWELGEDKDDIYCTSNVPGSLEQAFRILKLKNDELWLRNTLPNGDKYIYKYGR